jgi:hypothetical protein
MDHYTWYRAITCNWCFPPYEVDTVELPTYDIPEDDHV